jgi:alpha-L-fucosidase 2
MLPAQAARLVSIDYQKLVSRADLNYDMPASCSEEGIPVGNGRMGSLVWTTPAAMHFQVNRVDVFAEDSTTTSFPKADSDYASGCAYVDIELAQYDPEVFSGPAFHQSLWLQNGLIARGAPALQLGLSRGRNTTP